ncbi:F0F1 ATP synthase subunit B [Puniceicoccus vermicola]|uniref:ATP synthase subunit b n=1 Tax=Puniceicoccus vermicola TaxID=388746 RepID=A0A7X1AUJ2_9BACT|nr:F0F1 ATP synthase subunit B [Puniceicoccus vermicola]MBC2600271.1 F0F1 ATP synthase subunit B [Puniceicoccus vermicola]
MLTQFLTQLTLAAAPAVEGESGGPIQTIVQHFGLDTGFFFGQTINFLIVAALLYFLAFRPILRTVSERQTKIEDGLRYSEEMKAKLAEAEKSHEETLRKASVEAQNILKEAKAQAAALIETKTEEARTKAEDIIRRGEESLTAERKKMLDEVHEEVTRLVVATTRKVLDRELSDAEKSSFSDRAASELTESLR